MPRQSIWWLESTGYQLARAGDESRIFFFQAEDGIRDLTVTGVQTCALPICMAWLVREGDVLATAEIAETKRARRRGLLGRREFEGALVLPSCRHVHTFFMRFRIDVAFCDRDGTVLRTSCLRPWRISPLVANAAFAIEAEAGAFERWGLRAGDQVEVKE